MPTMWILPCQKLKLPVLDSREAFFQKDLRYQPPFQRLLASLVSERTTYHWRVTKPMEPSIGTVSVVNLGDSGCTDGR